MPSATNVPPNNACVQRTWVLGTKRYMAAMLQVSTANSTTFNKAPKLPGSTDTQPLEADIT